MIVKSHVPFKIGEFIFNGYIIDRNGNHHNYVPFKVLEEVTKKDFLDECAKYNDSTGIILEEDRFYRISVD